MRLGILGGSFNPVHAAHIRMAVEVLEQLELDRVDLIPAADPYHKPGLDMLPYGIRLQLVEAAVEEVPGLDAGDMERGLAGPSYTCELLREWKRLHPLSTPYFILGSETVLDLPKWKNGMYIPDMTNMAVVCRGNVGRGELDSFVEEYRPDAGKEGESWVFSSGMSMHYVHMPRFDICSTDIRQRWLRGQRLDCLVPDAVDTAMSSLSLELDKAWRRPNR